MSRTHPHMSPLKQQKVLIGGDRCTAHNQAFIYTEYTQARDYRVLRASMYIVMKWSQAEINNPLTTVS